MTKPIVSTEERWRRHQRDLALYRQRSLWRRSHARFHRDLWVVPFLFLAGDDVWMAEIRSDRDAVIDALRGVAVFTLDTASRLACGVGILPTKDVTVYCATAGLDRLVEQAHIAPPRPARLSLDPVLKRPPLLVAHHLEEPPPHVELPDGHGVVTWDRWRRDLIGTLGWRPDLLDRVEDAYARATAIGKTSSATLERRGTV